MTRSGRDYSWLPEHQLHAASTLAHADDLIARAGEVLFDYLKPPGPLKLGTVADGQLAHLKVLAIAPLPAAVARYAADALTQLRAAIEHTLFAEVEHQLGRQLKDDEARRIEMPASASADAFAGWLKGRRRPDLPPLHQGTPLVGRIRDLQPYRYMDVDNHPLRVLAAHTNLAKHRAPAVAATLLGAVIPDAYALEQRIAALKARTGDEHPIQPGDILFSGPVHERVPLSIWPKVSIQRPHTSTWHVVMNELGDLEDWVRTVAVPHLVTGRHEVDQLPPQLDTTIGYDDVRAALASAGKATAHERATRRIQASSLRPELVEILAQHRSRPELHVVETWMDTLDDDQVLERQDRLAISARNSDLKGIDAVMQELLAEAVQGESEDGGSL